MKTWKSYVGNTITLVKVDSTEYIINIFNSFDDDIQFTYEDEVKSKQPFLDVQLQRNGEGVKLSVNRKSTTNNVYMNLPSFAAES